METIKKEIFIGLVENKLETGKIKKRARKESFLFVVILLSTAILINVIF